MTFIDTSAIYALADRADDNHPQATRTFKAALTAGEEFFTHNYVLTESIALLQRRLGLAAALSFAKDADAFDTEWITRATHDQAVAWLRTTRRRQVSLVDAVSFLVMRSRGLKVAFAFDPHFVEQGFRLLAA